MTPYEAAAMFLAARLPTLKGVPPESLASECYAEIKAAADLAERLFDECEKRREASLESDRRARAEEAKR